MYGANFGSLISFRFIEGGCLTKGLHDSDLNVLVFLCCTCVAPTQSELSDSEVISFLLFVSLWSRFNEVKPYVHLQTLH